MPGPLHGFKIIDLTAVLLGPFATQHMADMGADVIKVEPPEGDLLRLSGGSMGRDKGMGPIYMAANRNKRSICLDLKKPAAVEILKGMIKSADLFIHNSRPAAIERLGLGYEDLKKINPSIIYAYSLGYARKGPYGHKPAFDDLVQGVSGAASLQSRVDGEAPKFMASLIADQMQEWLETEASDGFNVMFPYLPGGLDDFVDKVVPELQRRGLFRRAYEGRTLRENLGLPRPDNRFFAPSAAAARAAE